MSVISIEASMLSTFLNRLHLANRNKDRAYNPVGLVRVAIASMTVRGPIVLVEVKRLVVLQSEQHMLWSIWLWCQLTHAVSGGLLWELLIGTTLSVVSHEFSHTTGSALEL